MNLKPEFEILQNWGDLLAVYKPPGWLTIPGRGHKENTPVLSHALGEKLDKKIYVIHRLDEGTSGVLLFALTAEAHREISMKFENGEVKKTYWAIVEGRPDDQVIDAPLFKLPSKKIKSVVSKEKGKPSQTVIKVLSTWDRFSLVEAIPLTGRSHQIRVHLAHLGHPLVGDKLYGGIADVFPFPALHAHQLEFLRGVRAYRVECWPKTEEWTQLLSRFQFRT